MATVYRITAVHLSILKRQPPLLIVVADGETRTTGYTNCRLNPVIYVTPPEDGVWEFTFEADEPTGESNDQITPVSATLVWEDYPNELRGVRIMAEDNYEEAYTNRAGTANLITGAQQSQS